MSQVKTKEQPKAGFKLNKTQTALTTIGAGLSIGAIVYFVSKKNKAAAVVGILFGAVAGFAIDAKIQASKNK